ncbi:DNA adenine methylase [bacterium]|nr:DNA adenine methylase [bacterium]
MVKNILPLFPPHKIYVEPFGGAASLLLAKRPSQVEVYNDRDEALTTFFRVLRDPMQVGELQRRAYLTPYSRGEWHTQRELLLSGEGTEIDRAFACFYVARGSFGGMFGHTFGRAMSSNGQKTMVETVARYLNAVSHLHEVGQRFMQVQVENLSWQSILTAEHYDGEDTLVYCDPPYVPETRAGGQYRHEMTLEDHELFVALLLDMQGMVILSGYDHDVYQPLVDAEWERHEFSISMKAAGHTRHNEDSTIDRRRTEVVWVNPTAVEARRRTMGDQMSIGGVGGQWEV